MAHFLTDSQSASIGSLRRFDGSNKTVAWKAVQEMARQWLHLDSNQSVFFLRQLEYIMPKTYDVIFAELKALKFLPTDTSGGNGVDKITYRSFTQVGSASWVANYAKDFNNVDISGKEVTNFVRPMGDSYTYTIDDIRKAEYAGLNLEQRRANMAARAIAQFLNLTAFYGDSSESVYGWFSNGNVPVIALPTDGSGSSSQFINKSPDQIIRDVGGMIASIPTLTNETEMPNSVILPTDTFYLLNQTMSNLAANQSILQWLKGSYPMITSWETSVELKTAGVGGVRRMIAYDKNPDKITLHIPQPFEQFAPVQQGLAWTVNCLAKTGGVALRYPQSCVFADGC